MTASNHDPAATVVNAATHPAPSAKRIRTEPTTSTIEQAMALRDALRGVAQQAGELARSLKQQKRQARIVGHDVGLTQGVAKGRRVDWIKLRHVRH